MIFHGNRLILMKEYTLFLSKNRKDVAKRKITLNRLTLSTLQRGGTSSFVYVFGQDVTLDEKISVLHWSTKELQDLYSNAKPRFARLMLRPVRKHTSNWMFHLVAMWTA